MVNFFSPNVYTAQGLATNFVADDKGKNPPDIIFTPKPGDGNRYPIRVLVIGIPPGVSSVIQELYLRGFAEMAAWSPAIKAQRPDEIMRVTTRYFLINP